jgi:hypothetical protein
MSFRTREPDHVGNLITVLKSYLNSLKPRPSRVTTDGQNFIVSARDGGPATVINGEGLRTVWSTAARLKRWAAQQKLQ